MHSTSRVVLDTNLLVQATLSPHGEAARMLDASDAGKYDLVTSPKQLYELEQTLSWPSMRRRGITQEQAERFIVAFEGRAVMHRDPQLWMPLTRDPDDNYLVALAQSSQSILVSRDGGVLKEHPTDMQVMHPTEFWRLLETQ